jgi:hypothetical protein
MPVDQSKLQAMQMSSQQWQFVAKNLRERLQHNDVMQQATAQRKYMQEKDEMDNIFKLVNKVVEAAPGGNANVAFRDHPELFTLMLSKMGITDPGRQKTMLQQMHDANLSPEVWGDIFANERLKYFEQQGLSGQVKPTDTGDIKDGGINLMRLLRQPNRQEQSGIDAKQAEKDAARVEADRIAREDALKKEAEEQAKRGFETSVTRGSQSSPLYADTPRVDAYKNIKTMDPVEYVPYNAPADPAAKITEGEQNASNYAPGMTGSTLTQDAREKDAARDVLYDWTEKFNWSPAPFEETNSLDRVFGGNPNLYTDTGDIKADTPNADAYKNINTMDPVKYVRYNAPADGGNSNRIEPTGTVETKQESQKSGDTILNTGPPGGGKGLALPGTQTRPSSGGSEEEAEKQDPGLGEMYSSSENFIDAVKTLSVGDTATAIEGWIKVNGGEWLKRSPTQVNPRLNERAVASIYNINELYDQVKAGVNGMGEANSPVLIHKLLEHRAELDKIRKAYGVTPAMWRFTTPAGSQQLTNLLQKNEREIMAKVFGKPELEREKLELTKLDFLARIGISAADIEMRGAEFMHKLEMSAVQEEQFNRGMNVQIGLTMLNAGIEMAKIKTTILGMSLQQKMGYLDAWARTEAARIANRPEIIPILKILAEHREAWSKTGKSEASFWTDNKVATTITSILEGAMKKNPVYADYKMVHQQQSGQTGMLGVFMGDPIWHLFGGAKHVASYVLNSDLAKEGNNPFAPGYSTDTSIVSEEAKKIMEEQKQNAKELEGTLSNVGAAVNQGQ